MTTATCESTHSELNAIAPTGAEEIRLSDAEIMERVRQIRANWSDAERAARRREADRRFETLIETLFAEAA
jgi:hypothetical protein